MTTRPHVMLVTLDTVRADHCSLYGYERDTTPNLQRIAANSTVFEAAYAPMATTGPSHASLFTSLYPRTHGFVKNGYVLSERFATMAEMLRAKGYQTAAVVGSYAVSSRFGFSQGFDAFDEDFERDGREISITTWEGQMVDGIFDRDARHVTDRAIQWVAENRDPSRPFFLWAHYFDAHSPYAPAPEYRKAFPVGERPGSLVATVAAYDAEIREVDEAVGRLIDNLDASGLLDSTIVVVVGDHGEGLMQHGHLEHGLQIYEEAVRVPFVLSWPMHPAGQNRIREPVELIDVVPTVSDLLGFEGPVSSMQGRSLRAAVVDGTPLDPLHPVFLERRFYRSKRVGSFEVSGGKFAVRSGTWKFIIAPEEGTAELYDLGMDPGETVNVCGRHANVSKHMWGLIEDWYAGHSPDAGTTAVSIDEAGLEGLRALGYVD